jgi:hypothetical protein
MRFGLLSFAETDMLKTIAAVLLVLVVGICVIVFPFVLWMLFGDGPRSRHRRYTSRPRGNATGSSGWGEDRKNAPSSYDEGEE